jgi:hypothetical protein
MLKQAKLIATALCLALCFVGFASVSFAAGGGAQHDEHPATAEHHHGDMAQKDMMVDCPAHHDGHTMKDAQCAVACFTLLSAVEWHGYKVLAYAIESEGRITSLAQFYASHTLHIPTPPPNFA